MSIRRLFSMLILSASFHAQAGAIGTDNVVATLQQESAWMGQAIELDVVLYSPSPFTGTASFDLPEVPRTVIKKVGSPVVGSEQIDNKIQYTQRHEFAIYTQQSGTVTIPGIRVLFSSKESFNAPVDEIKGATHEIQFQSKRPPGTEETNYVVAATKMTTHQTWSPSDDQRLFAGDVVVRTVRQQADSTASMMLSPPNVVVANRLKSPNTVRVFQGKPTLSDQTQRGESNATREDIIKYQFVAPGSVTIPDLTFHWWDTENEALQHERLEGKTFLVEAAAATVDVPEQTAAPRVNGVTRVWELAGLLSLMVVASASVYRFQKKRVSSPITLASRSLLKACNCGDASLAYQALLRWRRLLESNGTVAICPNATKRLADCQSHLASYLYSGNDVQTSWNGKPLAEVVRSISYRHSLEMSLRSQPPDALPMLNPTRPNGTTACLVHGGRSDKTHSRKSDRSATD